MKNLAVCLVAAVCSMGAASPIGTNLAPICDWSTERPFADLMKQSRAWISNTESTWDDKRPLDVDDRGWVRSLLPGQRARTLLIWDQPVPAVEYTVTWIGKGTLDFWPQTAGKLEGNRATVKVERPGAGLALTISSTEKSDPIRDIHVWPKGLEGAFFHPAFLTSLKGYSTLRVMDWMQTNDSQVRTFASRPLAQDARYTAKGVPLEVMIELSNAAGADLWITVPDTWDDDANAKAAALVQRLLRKDLHVYAEHSNEVWNDIFPQASRAKAEGQRRGLADDPFEAQLRQHARRSVEIFKIWEVAFAKQPRRLVRTLGGMAMSTWATEVLLSSSEVTAHTDAIAIAPYFGGEIKGGATLDELFAALDASVRSTHDLIQAHKALADKNNVRLLAYEGGQHLVAHDNDKLDLLFTQANRDPRMKAVYLKALGRWKEGGGGLFVHFQDTSAPNKFGRWGARELIDQPRAEAPKLDALMTFAEATPRWW